MRSFGLMSRRRALLVPATVASYIPEGLYTAFLFIIIFPPMFGLPLWMANLITAQILVKAFTEMIVMGLILAALLGNRGFTEYIEMFFSQRSRPV